LARLEVGKIHSIMRTRIALLALQAMQRFKRRSVRFSVDLKSVRAARSGLAHENEAKCVNDFNENWFRFVKPSVAEQCGCRPRRGLAGWATLATQAMEGNRKMRGDASARYLS
jgi:hypothetical protein